MSCFPKITPGFKEEEGRTILLFPVIPVFLPGTNVADKINQIACCREKAAFGFPNEFIAA